MNTVPTELLITMIASILTAIVGMVASVAFSKKEMGQKDKSIEQAKDIVAAMKAESQASRARALELLAQKLPKTESPEELILSLEKLSSEIASRPLNNDQKDENSRGWGAVQNLINSYHVQALDQARVQFWFSVIAASVGFIWIIYSAVNIDTAQIGTILKTLPGVAMDTVAFFFFKQASETRERATALYDRLRTDDQRSQAILLVTSIEDERVRSAVKAQLTLHMAGLQPNPIDLSTFLAPQNIQEDSAKKNRA